MKKPDDIAQRLLGASYDSLDEHTQKVAVLGTPDFATQRRFDDERGLRTTTTR